MRKKTPAVVRRLLLAAYDAGKRSLPWRGETDPYRIWISEVMLQQTRVETAIPYYRRWLERFPDIEALASAEEDEVLRLWQGLGYYSRARRLREGARVVRERFGGSLPGSAGELKTLPGIGDYTAGAVASIAYGEAVPAVDGNVKRVLSRLFDLPNPSSADLGAIAAELVDPDRPGDFNQALMELGALVCVPRSPRCGECPLSSMCTALEHGTVAARPAAKARKILPEVNIAVVVAVFRDESGELHFLLRKRPPKGLLAGMWEFPGREISGEEGPGVEVHEAVPGSPTSTDGLTFPLPFPDLDVRPLRLEVVTHVFSHLKARYWPFLYTLEGPEGFVGPFDGPLDGCQWIALKEVDKVPLPVAQGKIVKAALEVVGA